MAGPPRSYAALAKAALNTAAREFSAAGLDVKDPAYEMLAAARIHKRFGLD